MDLIWWVVVFNFWMLSDRGAVIIFNFLTFSGRGWEVFNCMTLADGGGWVGKNLRNFDYI